MKKVQIFTDGACSKNPGPGGWGVVICYKDVTKELLGGEKETTNNQMELMAAIQGLGALLEPCFVNLYTDSKYLQEGISSWILRWRQNGWRTSSGKPVKNVELWIQLEEMCQKHEVHWCWIKGHAGHLYNERADTLSRLGMAPYLPEE